MAILDHSGELHCPQRPELLLDLREDELDGIVFRTVGHVEDASELESSLLCPGILTAVGREVAHEQGNLLIWVQVPQLLYTLIFWILTEFSKMQKFSWLFTLEMAYRTASVGSYN